MNWWNDQEQGWWNNVPTPTGQVVSSDGGGFFGNIKNTISAPIKAVETAGTFFGNMVKDVAGTAKTAFTGVRDVVQGDTAAKTNAITAKARLKLTQMTEKRLRDVLGAEYDNPNAAGWQSPSVQNILAESKAKLASFDKYTKDRTAENNAKVEKGQKVDPLKTGAATAETFLNVASLGIGGAAKQGAKTAVKEGAKFATKQIGKGATEGALIAGGTGALDPYAKQGADASPEDALRTAAIGGVLGGVLGGGAQMLNRDVRAGLREVPGAVRDATIKPAYADFDPASALDNATSSAEKARRQLMGEDITNQVDPNTAQFINETAASYNSPQQFIDDTVSRIWEQNKKGSGVNSGLIEAGNGEGSGYVGRYSQSNNSPFYQAYFREYGRPPSKAAIKDMVEQTVTGKPGEVRNLLTEIDVSPYDRDIYQQLADREASLQQTINQGPPADMYGQYAEKLGIPTTTKAPGIQAPPLLIDKTTGAIDNSQHVYQGGFPGTESSYYTTRIGEANAYATQGRAPGGEVRVARWGDLPKRITKGLSKQEYENKYGTHIILGAGEKVSHIGTTPSDLTGLKAEKLLGEFRPFDTNPQQVAPIVDEQSALTRALGRKEAQTNNAVDFIDTSGLPSPAIRRTEQQKVDTSTPSPYEGMSQNLETKALPSGELPKPATPAKAKAVFKKDGDIVDFVNSRPPSSKPIELPARTEDMRGIATRQTPGGKVKPLARNNAHITNDDVAAIRAIAEDNTSNQFTMTKTPEMNLEAALKNRGGSSSKEFRTLDKFHQSVRQHSADYSTWLSEKRDWLEQFIKEGSFNGKSAAALRPYLEAADGADSKAALEAYRKQFGDQAASAAEKLRIWWRMTKDQVRSETNDQIKTYAGEDRMMGDLGPTYVPRVYRSGTKGFKESFLDLAHGGMDAIGGEKGLFNLKSGTGYLGKESESMGGTLRNAEGIPLNSEFAKPNTTYLSAAQKRTANAPVKQMEDPLTSMMRYFEATGRAKFFTEDIARGQTLRDAIQMVNNETGNLRQMYKSFEDQVNAIAGKTARIDRPIVDSEVGSKFVNVASKLQSKISRSTIIGSANSVIAQTGQLPLIAAENGGKNFMSAMSDMMRLVKKSGDDPMAKSPLMQARYSKYDDVFKVKKSSRASNKATAIIAKPFRLVEHAASELAWRSSYRRVLSEGLKGKEAIAEADRITAKIVGERSAGARAALYESRALSPVSAYTLEVNQMYQVAKQYFKNDPKRAAKLVAAIWIYNEGYSAVTGNKLNADPLQATLDAGKILTDQNYVDSEGNPIGMGERALRAGGRLAGEAIDATPFGGPLLGELYPQNGFRVPFAGGDRTMSRTDVFGSTNFGRYGGGTPLASGLSNPLLMLGIPGMAQLQRSVEGANMVSAGASTTPSGDVRFDVNPSQEELWRAILLGQYGTKAGQDYLRQQNASLAGYNLQ